MNRKVYVYAGDHHLSLSLSRLTFTHTHTHKSCQFHSWPGQHFRSSTSDSFFLGPSQSLACLFGWISYLDWQLITTPPAVCLCPCISTHTHTNLNCSHPHNQFIKSGGDRHVLSSSVITRLYKVCVWTHILQGSWTRNELKLEFLFLEIYFLTYGQLWSNHRKCTYTLKCSHIHTRIYIYVYIY